LKKEPKAVDDDVEEVQPKDDSDFLRELPQAPIPQQGTASLIVKYGAVLIGLILVGAVVYLIWMTRVEPVDSTAETALNATLLSLASVQKNLDACGIATENCTMALIRANAFEFDLETCRSTVLTSNSERDTAFAERDAEFASYSECNARESTLNGSLISLNASFSALNTSFLNLTANCTLNSSIVEALNVSLSNCSAGFNASNATIATLNASLANCTSGFAAANATINASENTAALYALTLSKWTCFDCWKNQAFDYYFWNESSRVLICTNATWFTTAVNKTDC
jgi:hypothetical protein